MEFINAYKKLEKLCNDKYKTKHGISIYIDEMNKHKDGNKIVSSWNKDYKKLKHYRWLRNKIVHDIDANEKDLCTTNDTKWLNNFSKRMQNNKDPLSLYNQNKNKTIKKLLLTILIVIIILIVLFYIS